VNVGGQNVLSYFIHRSSQFYSLPVKFNKWNTECACIYFLKYMYVCTTANTCETEASKVHASLSIHEDTVYKSRIYLLTCIYFTIPAIRHFSYMLTCVHSLYQNVHCTPAGDYKSSFVVKFETTINDRIDFHKEEPIPRNTDLSLRPSFGVKLSLRYNR